MAFNDTVTLSYVAFRQHVNLGGESSRSLSQNGLLCSLELLSNGMVRVKKLGKTFFVAAVVVESCEAAEIPAKLAPKPVKTGKRTDSDAHLSRADEILAEMAGK